MNTLIRRGALAVVPVLVLAACSTSNPTSPTTSVADSQLNMDVAQYSANMTADDMTMFSLQSAGAMGEHGGWFGVMPFGFQNLTISRQVTFYNGTDVVSSFDPTATDSINFLFHMEGSYSRTGDQGTLDVSVNRDRDVTLSGLGGDETERTWNGTGSSATSRVRTSDTNGDRSYDMSSTTTIDNVIVPVPRSWPLSGTITRTVHVEIIEGSNEPVVKDRTVVITFNGTQTATLTIDGGDPMDLDLSMWRCHRRH